MRLLQKVATILLILMASLLLFISTGYGMNEAPVKTGEAQAVSDPAEVLGTWRYIYSDVDGMMFSSAEMGVSMTLKLYDSGRFTISYSDEEAEDDDGPFADWSLEDGMVVLFSEEESPIYYALVDGCLVTEEDGVKMIYSRDNAPQDMHPELIAKEDARIETSPSSLPIAPFAQKVATGDILYPGMSKNDAEAITGAPVEEGMCNQMIYEGVTLAYRDALVVYIQINDDRWAANGIVTPGMPTEQAVTALGMTFYEGSDPYTLGYFEDGTSRQLHPCPSPDGDNESQWALTLSGKRTVGMIAMGDRQYRLTLQ